jgi:hypothetical protein
VPDDYRLSDKIEPYQVPRINLGATIWAPILEVSASEKKSTIDASIELY